jgi:putative transposase
LAEYVGEEVVIRFVPSDITSIRVFHNGRFLCQPICSELTQLKVGIKDVQQARNERRKKIKKEISERGSLTEAIIAAGMDLFIEHDEILVKTERKTANNIKLYQNE